jgi:hypothetical protein
MFAPHTYASQTNASSSFAPSTCIPELYSGHGQTNAARYSTRNLACQEPWCVRVCPDLGAPSDPGVRTIHRCLTNSCREPCRSARSSRRAPYMRLWLIVSGPTNMDNFCCYLWPLRMNVSLIMCLQTHRSVLVPSASVLRITWCNLDARSHMMPASCIRRTHNAGMWHANWIHPNNLGLHTIAMSSHILLGRSSRMATGFHRDLPPDPFGQSHTSGALNMRCIGLQKLHTDQGSATGTKGQHEVIR